MLSSGGTRERRSRNAGIIRGMSHSFDALHVRGGGEWPLTIAFIFLAPMIGLVSAYILMIAVYWIFRNFSPSKMDVYFRKLQLLSAAAFSLSHGSNDAQKTAGLITGVLFTSHLIPTFDVPIWVILSRARRHCDGHIERRLAHRTHDGGAADALKPRSGFCAETGAAGAVLLATHLGLPVSTTHAIAGRHCGGGEHQSPEGGVVGGIATNIVGRGC
ncbi:MAG: inorganic phosphate transporter [Ignavibacteriota bacterium]